MSLTDNPLPLGVRMRAVDSEPIYFRIRKWTVYEEECLRLELDKKYGINRKLTPKMEMIRQVLHVRKVGTSKR